MGDSTPKTRKIYHKGTPRQVKREGGVVCTNPSCISGVGEYCQSCGFNIEEAERRKALPLIADEAGISRMYVGIHTKNDE